MMHKPSVTTHPVHEADIGSGEKPPSQQETEEMIRQVPARPELPNLPPATPGTQKLPDPAPPE